MISRVNSLRIGARYFVAATLILSLLVSSFGIERFSLAQGAEETVEEPVVVENNHSGENVEPPPQSGETPAENPEGEASISTEQPDAQSEPAGTTSLVIPVTGVTVTPETATINVGGTVALTAAVEPAEATNQAVAWASDNEAIATVDATGLVTAVAAGAATITAATAEGNFTATGTISVFANDNFVNRVVLSGLSGKISGGNAGATKESGEPNHGGNIGG
ncbi:MAG: Ig-like domain-containing protein, partial [Dethiobacter sp.]|nr:Ig-like domain-containing protein [Dethiobacter sp.]